MISLRGPVKRNDNGEWQWSGVWAFGALEADGEEVIGLQQFISSLENGATHKFTPHQRQKGPLPFHYKFNDAQMDKEVSRTVSVTECDGSSNDKIDATTSSSESTAVVTPANIPLETQSQSQQASKQEGSVVSSESTPTGSPLHEEHREEGKIPAGGESADASVSNKKLQKNKKLESSTEAPESDTKESGTQQNISQTDSVSATLSITTCPREGSWMGSFLNVSKKMDRTPLKPVDETFDMQIMNSPQKNPALKVRGTGCNKFGKFELTGTLEMKENTQILTCQKVYIPEPVKKRGRGRPKLLKSTDASSSSTATGVSSSKSPSHTAQSQSASSGKDNGYYTRKRIMSWQRPVSSDSEDEKPAKVSINTKASTSSSAENTNSTKNPRKRGRPPSNIIQKPRSYPQPLSQQHHQQHQQRAPGFYPAPPQIPKQSVMKSTSFGTSVNQKSNVNGSHKGSGIHKSNGNAPSSASAVSPAAMTSMPAAITTLPSCYSPIEARWLAAHYMNVGGVWCVYEGDLDMGGSARHGQGTTLYPDNKVYRGSYKSNKEHGVGELRCASNDVLIYKGEWERGKVHGRGVYYYYREGDADFTGASAVGEGSSVLLGTYEGEFNTNLRHGLGKYSMPDGSYYEGEWQNNERCGRGTMVWADGSHYEGQWRFNQRNGSGTLKTSDGFHYDGQWANNSMEGRGTGIYFLKDTQQRYEGMWNGGKKEGRGTIVFDHAKASYEGRFKNDTMEGQGTLKMSAVTEAEPCTKDVGNSSEECPEHDWLIPIEFQSDLAHIHSKAGFTKDGG